MQAADQDSSEDGVISDIPNAPAYIITIISMKNLLPIYDLKLSNLCKGSGALITVKPIRPQHSLASSHSND
jgi:hypothetical protein